MKSIILIVLMLPWGGLLSSSFETDFYVIGIESLCPEGNVTCDEVRFTVKEKKAGAVVEVIGRTLHTVGADGITPSKFLGYQFTLNGIVYFLGNEGILRVTKEGADSVVEVLGMNGDRLHLDDEGEGFTHDDFILRPLGAVRGGSECHYFKGNLKDPCGN